MLFLWTFCCCLQCVWVKTVSQYSVPWATVLIQCVCDLLSHVWTETLLLSACTNRSEWDIRTQSKDADPQEVKCADSVFVQRAPKQVVFESLRTFQVLGEVILKPVLLILADKALAMILLPSYLSTLPSHHVPRGSDQLSPFWDWVCKQGCQAVLSLCPGPRVVGSFSSFSSLFRCHLLSEAVLLSSLKDPLPNALGSIPCFFFIALLVSEISLCGWSLAASYG